MTLKHGVLCFFALLIMIFLGLKNYETWTSPLVVSSEKSVPKKAGPKPDAGQSPIDQKDQKTAPSIASYIFISQNNPFSPDRKEFPIPAAAPTGPVVKPPPVRPQVTLYGVMIAGDYRSASISYPGRPLQKGERDVATVKIGDRVGEYKVAAISEDRIKLDAQEDNFEVFLYDARNPKRRTALKTENKPAAVTSTTAAPPEAPKPGGPAVPGAPGAAVPIQAGVAGAPAPVPVTPANIPIPSSPRSRRFFGPKPSGGE